MDVRWISFWVSAFLLYGLDLQEILLLVPAYNDSTIMEAKIHAFLALPCLEGEFYIGVVREGLYDIRCNCRGDWTLSTDCATLSTGKKRGSC